MVNATNYRKHAHQSLAAAAEKFIYLNTTHYILYRFIFCIVWESNACSVAQQNVHGVVYVDIEIFIYDSRITERKIETFLTTRGLRQSTSTRVGLL